MELNRHTKLFIVSFGTIEEPGSSNGVMTFYSNSSSSNRPSNIYVLATSYDDAAKKGQEWMNMLNVDTPVLTSDGSINSSAIKDEPFLVKAVKLATEVLVF